ncbi:prepilin-type N-terminal cleavage/methylation domain-containing protein [Rhodocyclaceae bacterium SMB388]
MRARADRLLQRPVRRRPRRDRPNPRPGQAGVSLVELMIGMSIALLMLAGLLSFFVTFNKNQFDLLRGIRLEQEIRSTLDFMVRDLRRAGFWRNAHLDLPQPVICNASFFDGCAEAGPPTPIFSVSGSAISYAYDADDSGEPARFGFRLRSGAVEYHANGQWLSLTDATATRFTQLEITPTERAVDFDHAHALTIRMLRITATAAVPNHPQLVRTVTREVRIRNDDYIR